MEQSTNDPPETPNYAAWVNVVLGLCVFTLHWASPRGTLDIKRNLFLTGIVIMFVALATAIAHQGNSNRNYWSAFNILTGLWLIVSRDIFVPIAVVALGQLWLGIAVAVVATIALLSEMLGEKRAGPSVR